MVSNWGTLLLSLAFLASLDFFSLLTAACLLPRAEPISFTHTHTDTLPVTRALPKVSYSPNAKTSSTWPYTVPLLLLVSSPLVLSLLC